MKTLRPYQKACVDAAFDWLSAGNPNFFLLIAPVAAGKSLIMAELMKRILSQWGRVRIVSVVHSAKLITQNAQEFAVHCPEGDWGYYSASVGQKRLNNDVTFSGIQTIYNKAHLFNRAPQVIIVDEVHMVSHDNETMYRRFINDCLALNPNLVVIGLSGCKWRADTGRLDEGETRLFQGIAYEIPIQFLIDEGYWVRPTTQSTHARLSVEGVGTSKGDYIQSQLETAVDVDETTQKCVDELIAMAGTRKRWFGMTAGVKHCTHVRDAIRSRGIACEMVVGDVKLQSKEDRNNVVSWFDTDTPDVRVLLNIGTLNVGYDNKLIDLLFPMCPTKSPVKYYQYVGRGVRPLYTNGYDLNTKDGRLAAIANSCKPDVLLCDFSGIVDQLGPIDSLDVQKKFKPKKEDAEPGEAITKRCPSCGIVCAGAQRYCYGCGYSFISEGLSAQASKAAVVSSDTEPEEHAVLKMQLTEHMKAGAEWEAPRTMKVTYITLAGTFYDFMCFEHHKYEVGDNKRYAWERAVKWHAKMLPDSGLRPPITVQEALTMGYKTPTRVKVKKDGKYWRVLDVYFDSDNIKPAMDVFTDLQKEIEARRFAFKEDGIDLDLTIPF